jgi:hypothetical protein
LSVRVGAGPIFVTLAILLAGLVCALVVWVKHENAGIASRFAALVADVQTLRPGLSDWRLAKAVAERHGRPPKLRGVLFDISDPDCRQGYYDRCRYVLFEPDNLVGRFVAQRPWFSRLGASEAFAMASIRIEKGIVQDCAFWVTFRTTEGQSRLVEIDAGADLEGVAGVMQVTPGYTVRRGELIGEEYGLYLAAGLKPAASPSDTRRAWDLALGCLTRPGGCSEVCEVLPSAWQDYYRLQGRDASSKLGERYRLCTDKKRIDAVR